ncbi:aminopeptidase N-like [Cimex lectularius]|uniref:Aminopeptidase n=1 Tax=Cimex lectularius TaxID=79782 RepID=A0A8I6RA70_CIMLE|nr:aminopeptidase N-like [Cimex lectularius]
MGPSPHQFVGFFFILASATSTNLHRRLPRNVVPVHYHIDWVVTKCEFSGKESIDLEVRNSTDSFKLHSRDLQVDFETVKITKLSTNEDVNIVLVNGENKDVESFEYFTNDDSPRNLSVNSVKGDRLKVSLSEPLEVGSKYRLYMEFNGTMNSRKAFGFYCQRYRHGNQTKWLASTSFEPGNARSAFPCFDEPGLRANFTISITHDKKMTALSNMPLSSSAPSDLGEDCVVDTFETSPKMSTYLVSAFVGEYDHIDSKYLKNKPIRVWAHKEKVSYGDLPLRLTARHLSFLQNYTGVSDPMPKQDLLAIRNFAAGGVENWGLITYDERFLLFNPRHRRNKQVVLRACNLIAHELAHIWFGNLVALDSWRDIWLNEGFSTYFAALSTNKVYREYDTQAWILAKESAMLRDCKWTTHPLRPDLELDARDIFDEITYYKGSSILRMLNFTLGEDVLKEGVRNYLQEKLYSTACHKVLWANLEKAAVAAGHSFPEGVTLEQIMDAWLNKPGYPVVTVSRDYTTGEVTISQKSVLEKEEELREESESDGWFVPLSYTFQDEKDSTVRTKIWLDPRQPNLTIPDPAAPDRWLLFNLMGASYCRIRYDSTNAKFLLNDLSNFWIDDRVLVLSDMLELARIGFAPVEGTFDALTFLKDELSPYPWLALLSSTSKTVSFFEGTELESIYVDFLNGILSSGMERLDESSPHRKELITLSCKLGVEQCTKMGRELFRKWAENPNNEIPEDIRYPVVCLGVAEGDAKTWELVNNRLSTSHEASEKKDILKALACSKDEKLLLKYLQYGLSSNKTAFSGKKLSVILKSLAKQHPDFVLNTLSEKNVAPPKHNTKWQRLLEILADQVNSPERLEKFTYIVSGSSDSFKSAVRKSPLLTIAESNLEWFSNNKHDAEAWLRNHQQMKRQV